MPTDAYTRKFTAFCTTKAGFDEIERMAGEQKLTRSEFMRNAMAHAYAEVHRNGIWFYPDRGRFVMDNVQDEVGHMAGELADILTNTTDLNEARNHLRALALDLFNCEGALRQERERFEKRMTAGKELFKQSEKEQEQ